MVGMILPMKRGTVYLRPQQVETLRDLAKQRGVSFAEIVRQGVDCFLMEEDWLWNIISIADGSPTDLAERHDGYLTEIMAQGNR